MTSPVTPRHLTQIKNIIDGDEQWLLTHQIASLPSEQFTKQTGNTSEIIMHNEDGFLLLLHPHNPNSMFPPLQNTPSEIVLYFAYVCPDARGTGKLRKMLSAIPGGILIRLEATKKELVPLWQHLGFTIDSYQPYPETTTLLHRTT